MQQINIHAATFKHYKAAPNAAGEARKGIDDWVTFAYPALKWAA